MDKCRQEVQKKKAKTDTKKVFSWVVKGLGGGKKGRSARTKRCTRSRGKNLRTKFPKKKTAVQWGGKRPNLDVHAQVQVRNKARSPKCNLV